MNEGTGRSKSNLARFLLLPALALLVFLIINLSDSIGNYRPLSAGNSSGLTPTTSSLTASAPPPVQVGNPSASQSTVSPVLIALILIVTIGVVFYIYARKRRGNWEEGRPILGQVLGGLFALGLLLLLIEVVRFAIFGLALFVQYAFVILIIAVSLFGLGLLYGKFDLLAPFRRSVSDLHGNEPSQEQQKRAKQFKEILAKTTSSLDLGSGEYRRRIIDCYMATLSLFEDRGVSHDLSLTAREFEEMIAKGIGTNSIYLHGLTLLFERARYSDDELSKKEVEQALQYLTSLEQDLNERGPVVQQAQV